MCRLLANTSILGEGCACCISSDHKPNPGLNGSPSRNRLCNLKAQQAQLLRRHRQKRYKAMQLWVKGSFHSHTLTLSHTVRSWCENTWLHNAQKDHKAHCAHWLEQHTAISMWARALKHWRMLSFCHVVGNWRAALLEDGLQQKMQKKVGKMQKEMQKMQKTSAGEQEEERWSRMYPILTPTPTRNPCPELKFRMSCL